MNVEYAIKIIREAIDNLRVFVHLVEFQNQEDKGGRCIICDYDKCQQVLQFHHKNPNEKEFALSNSGTLDFEKLKNEADKCILVCANCHGEIHAGLIDISKYL